MENEKLISNIEKKIYHIRGVQVMMDSDLANLYGVQTKVLNQAVKRNMKRFPESFMFRLTDEERLSLRSQFVTLKAKSSARGVHKKYSPIVFTELGIAMLSSVLNSESAIQINIEIIQVFVQLRRSFRNEIFLCQKVDNLEKKLIQHELRFDEFIETMSTKMPETTGIFFNDQIFDAYVFSSELIKSAKKSVVLIDNHVDEVTLLQLSKRGDGVACIIYTERLSSTLQLDLDKHNAQFPTIQVVPLKNVHDRFLIIDDEQLYHMGASLKDRGKRWFAFSRIDGLLAEIQSRLK